LFNLDDLCQFAELLHLLWNQKEGADDTTVIAISLYESNEAMKRADDARNKSIDSANDIASIDMKVGTVEINHSK